MASGAHDTNNICQLCGKYQTNIKPKRRYWRNPRQYSEGDGRWKTFVMGLKELLDIQDKDSHNKNKRTSFKIHEKHVNNEHHKDASVMNGIGTGTGGGDDEDILDERTMKE
eukprot:125066_1